ncbi:MAG: formate dehydrogenase subunit alpha [Deltaproteobacteria bacterium]|nr:formate dehydrogenase subunit alpha [Deltaproteobacteria bacterium]
MKKLTIDGRPVTVEKAGTVLEACREAGVYIPTLCADEDLEPYGACRLCIVKIEGLRGLPTSCTTRVADGMKIVTDDDELRAVRTMTLQLLLSDHPGDCVVCAKSSECGLHEAAEYLGIRERLLRPLHRETAPDDSNPCFAIDYAKCVFCGKCVRACAEINGCGAIDLYGRGFKTRIEPFGGGGLRASICESCGECVVRCPTGALSPRQSEVPAREGSSICPYCGVGCRIQYGVKGNRIVGARGDRSGPANRGRLCVKGRYGSFEFVGHNDRLTRPLVRENDRLREATWDEALGAVAAGLDKRRGEVFAGLSSAKVPNEDNYVFQQFVRATMGTNNVDHCARLCHASTVAGLALSFGSGAMTNPADDLLLADTILITGTNTTENHPVFGFKIREAVARGTKLIVFDPRKIPLTRQATLWCRQRPGTDVAWINGLANVILEEKLHKPAFIAERTEGFEAFAEVARRYPPDRAAKITGVPADDIVAAARLYGGANAASIVYSMGITQHTTGVDNVRSLANLAMLTGHIGRPGTGVNPLRGQNNVQGSCDMGALPNVLPGYQQVADEKIRAKFEAAWGAKLPPKPGLTVSEVFPAALEGRIKALYIMGENPMLSDPDVTHVEAALRKLEFLVVQDIFLTETAKLAHVVLPALAFPERDGTYTNTERRVQLTQPFVAPPGADWQGAGGPRRDWRILCDVSERLGRPMRFESTQAVWDEMRGLTPSMAGIAWSRLEGSAAVCWPCPAEDHPGTPILHAQKFTRGLGQFAPIEYKPAAEEPDKEFPFVLTTGRMLEHYHTGTMTRRSKALHGLEPEGFVELNGKDATALRVAKGGFVRVVTRRGAVRARVRLNDRVDRGTLFMPFHFVEAAANVLTNPAYDPIAKIPEYKVCAARVERA